MKHHPVNMDYFDAERVVEAMEDAKVELETIEAQLEWYSCFKVCDKLEIAIEQMKIGMAEAESA
jgi:hypothetical protein